jgi:uncharacterized membrane protein
MMNKTRIEALSDGVFAIVMTILIIELKVPNHDPSHGIQNSELWEKLWALWPLWRSYFISFLILIMYWTAHHAFFHIYLKRATRWIALLNNIFLMFIGCVPFSAHLLGEYPKNELAVFVYGLNVIVIGIVLFVMLKIVDHHPELMHEDLSRRLIVQEKVRILMPPLFAVFAILLSFVTTSGAFFLFTFPIFFNIIPGTLNTLEKIILKRKAD